MGLIPRGRGHHAEDPAADADADWWLETYERQQDEAEAADLLDLACNGDGEFDDGDCNALL